MVQPTVTAPSRRRRGRRLAVFLILLSLLALGGMYATTAILVRIDNVLLPGVELAAPEAVRRVLPGRSLPGLDSKPVEGSPGTVRINILVLGIDRRPHHTSGLDGAPNSDSMHIVSLDPVSRTATVLSLPRDLYVEIPSPTTPGEFTEGRINTAYHLGEEYKLPGGGAAFAKRLVEQSFHIPIDHYVVLDWVAFADVIDALGGIELTVPRALEDVQAYNPRDGNAFTISIRQGFQGMDPVTALAYARFRDDDEGDFGRVRRQQDVMRAASNRALQLGWLGQGSTLYGRFRGAVDTDVSTARLLALANLARVVNLDQAQMLSAAGPDAEAVRRVITPYGEDVLVPIWDVMAPIIRTAVDDRLVREEGAGVTVVNSTGIPGQGRRTAAYLARFSIPAERITATDPPPDQPPQAKTTITVTGRAAETGARVAEWLNVPKSAVVRAEETGATQPGTVIVALGNDVRLPDDLRFNRYLPR